MITHLRRRPSWVRTEILLGLYVITAGLSVAFVAGSPALIGLWGGLAPLRQAMIVITILAPLVPALVLFLERRLNVPSWRRSWHLAIGLCLSLALQLLALTTPWF